MFKWVYVRTFGLGIEFSATQMHLISVIFTKLKPYLNTSLTIKKPWQTRYAEILKKCSGCRKGDRLLFFVYVRRELSALRRRGGGGAVT
ncbi:hypothetical protein L6452_24466 [Arctium lappa]|uniref:Uncharacterized protein n=1 Tax=Arctium lappa TaxID=4217 RepID=A0ACB9AAH5_ARCLA|nr:hypothetical protein L6452_24466 [Arctium lappa]